MQIEPFGFDRKGNEQDLKITCQAHLWNWAKAVVCAKYYKDMDICNCHPVLLVQICKQHDLPCMLLERYINERAKLIAETGLSKPCKYTDTVNETNNVVLCRDEVLCPYV